jgi:hypothetical protein
MEETPHPIQKPDKEVQDIVFLIMNCKKYRSKALFQKNTWLKQLPSFIKFYHVIGDTTLNSNYRFYDNDDNMLVVKCEDDYNSLPKKVIRAYEAIHETFQYKYIFKSDDDQFLTNPQFFNIICNLLRGKENIIHYGGKLINITQSHYSTYNQIHKELPSNILMKPTKYSNGRFYFLSFNAIEYLFVNQKENIEKEFFEDYAIGFYLHPLLKKNTLFLNTSLHFKDFDDFPEYYLFLSSL